MDEIKLAPYNPLWASAFAAEAERLSAVLLPRMAIRVEHIGSTAVPGLAAKPIIDIMVLIASLERARVNAVKPLELAGYAYWAENPNPERMFFVRGLPPEVRRTHHLHLTESPAILARHLAFRDRMRNDAEEAARYAQLKTILAERHRSDREAYTAAKADYVARISAETRA